MVGTPINLVRGLIKLGLIKDLNLNNIQSMLVMGNSK